MHHEGKPPTGDAGGGNAEALPMSLEQMAKLMAMAQGLAAQQPGNSLTSLGCRPLPPSILVQGVEGLRELVEEFIETKLSQGRRPGTMKNYHRCLERLIVVCPELPVTPAHIRQAILNPSWSQTTRFLMFTHLRAFFSWLAMTYGVLNPCDAIGVVDRGRPKRRVLSLDQMGKVYDAADTDPGRRNMGRFCPRNRAIAMLMIECGPRVQEIANIRAQDVIDGWVHLDGKTGPRWVPVAPELTGMMQEMTRGETVFTNYRGGPMSDRDVNYLVRNLQMRAGIPGPKYGVHVMRHSFATNYLRERGGLYYLKEIMGHTQIQTTMRYVSLAGVDVQLDQSRTSLARRLGLLQS